MPCFVTRHPKLAASAGCWNCFGRVAGRPLKNHVGVHNGWTRKWDVTWNCFTCMNSCNSCNSRISNSLADASKNNRHMISHSFRGDWCFCFFADHNCATNRRIAQGVGEASCWSLRSCDFLVDYRFDLLAWSAEKNISYYIILWYGVE